MDSLQLQEAAAAAAASINSSWEDEFLQLQHSSPILINSNHNQMESRRKRKRPKPSKNKEEVERQRMSHIAVERNRRRQMNHHLLVIKSLLPTSYIQRGDQASIIEGAIHFLKELELQLQSLESNNQLLLHFGGDDKRLQNGSVSAYLKSQMVEIQVTMIQAHVNLKIKCPKSKGQLLKVIVAFQDLSLTVLHLNITTLPTPPTMLYTFNLKIEDESKLGSAKQIAEKVDEILNHGRVVNEEEKG